MINDQIKPKKIKKIQNNWTKNLKGKQTYIGEAEWLGVHYVFQ
jgi:hypothetical protein